MADIYDSLQDAVSVGDRDALVRGIAEITDVMLDEFNLNDVLTMILENIYSGMGFTRVLFCIHDRKNAQVIGRFARPWFSNLCHRRSVVI